MAKTTTKKPTPPADPAAELATLQLVMLSHTGDLKRVCELLVTYDVRGAIKQLSASTDRLEQAVYASAKRAGYDPRAKLAKPKKGGKR